MSLSTVAVVAFVLACLVAIQRRLHTLPRALLAVVRKERAEDASRLLDAMKEAVAARSGQAVIAVQTYHEQMAQSFRAQVAEAETRARVAERRALDTATALEAATTLVRELRATVEVSAKLVRHLLHAAAPAAAAPVIAPAAIPELDDTDRQTTEMPAVATGVSSRPQPDADAAPASGRKPRAVAPSGPDEGGDFDDDDEQTRVADRGGALSALRKARRSPTVLPPAPEPGASTASPLPRSPGQNDSAC